MKDQKLRCFSVGLEKLSRLEGGSAPKINPIDKATNNGKPMLRVDAGRMIGLRSTI
jgi:hypothetical protein